MKQLLIGILVVSLGQASATESRTILGIQGTRFTLNGKPTFLLGISFYAGLGAPEESLRRDLDEMRHHGFNWLRVWATCGFFEQDISVVDSAGRARDFQMSKLKRLVDECDRRGLVVDVTLNRDHRGAGGGVPDLEAHQKAVEAVVVALKAHHNWYLDLANERDVRDDRYVPVDEIKILRELVRRLDPTRLVTASFGGHDLGERDLRDALETAGLDFVARHRPRGPESPARTDARTRECLALLKKLGRVVPVHDQEPPRRGYLRWEPSAADILTDLRGSLRGGAAGWCFHNGSQRGTRENRPRRSFDLRTQRLFDQLDPEERAVVRGASNEVKRGWTAEQRQAPGR
ncbi:MAG: hypothetical protein ACP5XB_30440 [Isosphaeraceae bacterium]